jgi:HSP20 family protein
MANLGVFQPLQDLVNDLGRDLVVRPLGMAGQAISRIRLDVDEDDDGYTVRAEIPGSRKEDIRVSVEGNQVSLSAELRKEKDGMAGRRTVYSERNYGVVSRSFTLPGELEAGGALAQYQDGILTVFVPKKATSSGSRVPVT